MRVAILHKVIADCLSLLAKVGNNPTLPILNCVLIDANKDARTLTLSAANLDTRLDLCIQEGIEVTEAGQMAVDASQLAKYWAALPTDANIVVRADAGAKAMRVEFAGDGYAGRGDFPCQSATDFPPPMLDPAGPMASATITVGAANLLFGTIDYPISGKDSRAFLNGALFEVPNAETIRVAGSDGHRLALVTAVGFESDAKAAARLVLKNVAPKKAPAAKAKAKAKAPKDQPPPPIPPLRAVIPKDALTEMLGLIRQREDDVTIRVSHSAFQVSQGNHRLTSKLIEEEYPPIERLKPSGVRWGIEVDRKNLVGALTRATKPIKGGASKATGAIKTDGKTAEVYSQHGGSNPTFSETLPCVIHGKPTKTDCPPVNVSLNLPYLRDAVSAVYGDTVRLSFHDVTEGTAARLLVDTPNTRVASEHLIMALRDPLR